MRSRCKASVSKPGSLTLPAKKLYEIVKSLPETDIRITEDKSGVKVAADRFDSRMQTLPREDFPTLPESAGGSTVALAPAALKEMVSKTQFAITGEDTRFFLNGALFVLRADTMSLVATDGHRLALVNVNRDGKADGTRTSPRPRRFCRRRRWANWHGSSREGDGDIRYERGENHLFFDVGERVLISRMIDGQFPAYERVIPEGQRQAHRVRARSADQRGASASPCCRTSDRAP